MKILSIGDLHFGEKSNSPVFQEKILEFLTWVVGFAIEQKVDKVAQLGDYFHTRHKIDVQTLNVGLLGAELLSTACGKENTFVILGNHDLYFLNRLDVNSVTTLSHAVTVIDSLTNIADGVWAVPWVATGGQWDSLVDTTMEHKMDLLLGHFEFSGFMLNDGYKMEHGLSHKQLKAVGTVLSGHYHSKQQKGNVQYAGTPYPITMNEANESHGVWIYDTDTKKNTFYEYDKIKVLSVPHEKATAEFLDSLDPANTSIRVEFPDGIDPAIVEEVMGEVEKRELWESKSDYTSSTKKDIMDSDVEIKDVANIDEAVEKYIKNLSEAIKEHIDNEVLMNIYKKAKEIGDEE